MNDNGTIIDKKHVSLYWVQDINPV